MEQGYRDKNGVLLESGDRVEWLGNPLDRSSPYIEGVGPGALPRGYIEGVVLSVGQHLELQDSDDERYQYSYLHPSMITKVAHAGRNDAIRLIGPCKPVWRDRGACGVIP